MHPKQKQGNLKPTQTKLLLVTIQDPQHNPENNPRPADALRTANAEYDARNRIKIAHLPWAILPMLRNYTRIRTYVHARIQQSEQRT